MWIWLTPVMIYFEFPRPPIKMCGVYVQTKLKKLHQGNYSRVWFNQTKQGWCERNLRCSYPQMSKNVGLLSSSVSEKRKKSCVSTLYTLSLRDFVPLRHTISICVPARDNKPVTFYTWSFPKRSLLSSRKYTVAFRCLCR